MALEGGANPRPRRITLFIYSDAHWGSPSDHARGHAANGRDTTANWILSVRNCVLIIDCIIKMNNIRPSQK